MVAALAMLLLGGFLPAQKVRIKDTILRADGSHLRGVEVIAMTTSSVSYKRGSTKAKLPADQVVAIEWHEPPESYLLAQAAENKGDYDKAANFYAEAARGTERTVFKLELQFLAARALLSAAGNDAEKVRAAAEGLQAYLDAAPDGYHLPAARLGLARALRLGGQVVEAEAACKEIEALAVQGSWGLIWDARTKFEMALSQVAQKKYGDARSTYRGVITAVDAAMNAGDTNPQLTDLRAESLVGEGETFITEKQYDQALQFFRRFEGPPGLGKSTAGQAAALAGVGEALFLKAQTNKSHQALRQAQMALARANLLDTGNGETTAKALYLSGEVLLALSPDHEKDRKARAAAYFDSVVRSYSSTSWAARARTALAR